MIVAIEVFYLLLMTQSIMVHVTILPVILQTAGRDSWISALLSAPVGIVVIWIIYRLRLSFPSGFDDYIAKIAGKPTLIFLKIVFSVYFLFLSAFSLASLLDMVKYVFLQLTPLWALALLFMFCCLYMVHKGYKNIVVVAGILTYLSAISGIFIGVFDSVDKEWSKIFPLLEFGWEPVGYGVIVLSSIWAEMLFLLFIPIDKSKRKYFPRACFWGVGINGITMILTLAGVIMIFGLGQARLMNYPSLEIVRYLSLGFIDRFDVYGEVLMVFGTFIRSSLFLRIALDQVFSSSNHTVYRIALLFAGAVMMAAALLMAQTHFAYTRFLYYYVYGIILLPVPFIIYGLGLLRKKALN